MCKINTYDFTYGYIPKNCQYYFGSAIKRIFSSKSNEFNEKADIRQKSYLGKILLGLDFDRKT